MNAYRPVTRASVLAAVIAQRLERLAVLQQLGGDYEFDSDGRLVKRSQESK